MDIDDGCDPDESDSDCTGDSGEGGGDSVGSGDNGSNSSNSGFDPSSGPGGGPSPTPSFPGSGSQVIMGNDEFDAIMGAPGTYSGFDMYGNFTWGASPAQWQAYYAAQTYVQYYFTGGNGSVLEQQWESAAIQLGQAACAGQDPTAVTSCIQQAYDTMTVATNSDGSLMLVGGNYNFNYDTVSINGEGIDPTQLDGCLTLGQQTRCGIFDSLHFHDDQGIFHLDTGNAWFPIGAIVHLGWDIIGGNTVWAEDGIPRPWWQ
jgi:hypothetical protein